MTPNDPITSDDVEEALRGLQPAASQLDVSSVFYQAGYQAAIAGQSTPHRHAVGQLVLGVILTAAITAPVSYRAGALRSEVADKPAPNLEAIVETDPQVSDEVVAIQEDQVEVTISSGSDKTATGNRWLELLAGQWFSGEPESTGPRSMTLTAFHATTLNSTDTGRSWPESSFGIENRYRTFAVDQATGDDKKTLAIGDTIELAERLGDF